MPNTTRISGHMARLLTPSGFQIANPSSMQPRAGVVPERTGIQQKLFGMLGVLPQRNVLQERKTLLLKLDHLTVDTGLQRYDGQGIALQKSATRGQLLQVLNESYAHKRTEFAPSVVHNILTAGHAALADAMQTPVITLAELNMHIDQLIVEGCIVIKTAEQIATELHQNITDSRGKCTVLITEDIVQMAAGTHAMSYSAHCSS